MRRIFIGLALGLQSRWLEGPESCGIIKPPNVISTSFASDEADATPFYNTRQCNEYGKLGLMGVSILYSSGDEVCRMRY